MTLRLHRTKTVAIRDRDGVEYKPGLLDSTDTLSLTKYGGEWVVSSQHTGMRMYSWRLQSSARRYMTYMLRHAGEILRSISAEEAREITSVALCDLRDIHFKAVKHAGN